MLFSWFYLLIFGSVLYHQGVLAEYAFDHVHVDHSHVEESHVEQSPVVYTKTGAVRGRLISVPNIHEVYEFTGIPFARPPVGSLRFKKPLPVKPWGNDTVLNATTPSNACMQQANSLLGNFTVLVPGAKMSEDCLYLNIWVPKATLDAVLGATLKPAQRVPVYTFIYGGGFVTGASMLDIYNGTVFAGYSSLIVATIQYRVGALGFLNLGSEEAPGNMGLWDQLEGMKWIYENVGAFGGNNSEITIAGESAGSVSVSYHLLSPHSRRYFHRVIMESGTALAPWALHSESSSKAVTNLAIKMVADESCVNLPRPISEFSSVQEKLVCLRSANAQIFPQVDLVLGDMGYGFGWAPIIDGNFVPRDPAEMLRTGDFYKVPTLIGANKDEATWFFSGNSEAMKILPSSSDPLRSLDGLNMTHYSRLLEIGYEMFSSSPRPYLRYFDPLLFNAIQLHYWPSDHDGPPVGQEVASAVSQAAGDYAMTCPTFKWAQISSSIPEIASSVYVYHFTHRTSLGLVPEWMGVVHGDEMPYIFGEPLAPYAKSYGYSKDEEFLSKILMDYWASFVRHGDPNIRDEHSSNASMAAGIHKSMRPWLPYAGSDCPQQIFEINALTLVFHYGDATTCGLKSRDCLFWQDFFVKLAELSESFKKSPSSGLS